MNRADEFLKEFASCSNEEEKSECVKKHLIYNRYNELDIEKSKIKIDYLSQYEAVSIPSLKEIVSIYQLELGKAKENSIYEMLDKMDKFAHSLNKYDQKYFKDLIENHFLVNYMDIKYHGIFKEMMKK